MGCYDSLFVDSMQHNKYTSVAYHDEVHEDGVKHFGVGSRGGRLPTQPLLVRLLRLQHGLHERYGQLPVRCLCACVAELGERARDHLPVEVRVVHHQEAVLGGVWSGVGGVPRGQTAANRGVPRGVAAAWHAGPRAQQGGRGGWGVCGNVHVVKNPIFVLRNGTGAVAVESIRVLFLVLFLVRVRDAVRILVLVPVFLPLRICAQVFVQARDGRAR